MDRDHTEANDVLRAFEGRSESEKSAYLELHERSSAAFQRMTEKELGKKWQQTSALDRQVLAIWETNTFGDVFHLGSRFNHSCVPNINFT